VAHCRYELVAQALDELFLRDVAVDEKMQMLAL